MKRFKHRYIAYFYPREGEKKGLFLTFGRVSDLKDYALKYNRLSYDYKKIF